MVSTLASFSIFIFIVGVDMKIQFKSHNKCEIHNIDGSVREHKVLMFIDFKYLDVFVNWLLYYYDACGSFSRLEIICIDSRAEVDLYQLTGLKCSLVIVNENTNLHSSDASPGELASLWFKRIEVLQSFLHKSDIVFSDSDALWLKNPLDDITIHNAAIVASRSWWPWPLFREWGACVCMGFFYIRKEKFSINFVNEIYNRMKSGVDGTSSTLANKSSLARTFLRSDDQIAVNDQLKVWNVTWRSKKMNVGNNTKPDYGYIFRYGVNHKIVLLEHSKYIRKCHTLPLKFDGAKEVSLRVSQFHTNLGVGSFHKLLPMAI